jgi:hypothetical protein
MPEPSMFLSRSIRSLVSISVLLIWLSLVASAVASAKVTIKGPRDVPDFTAYAYTAAGCANPNWTVSDPVGSIASGQGTRNVVIEWGQGPKAVDIVATCVRDTGTLAVKVMQVTITDPKITKGSFEDGDHDPDPHYQYARLGDNDGAPPGGKPGIKFDATITVTGPIAGSSAGPDKITTGFVQILRAIPKWEGDYKAGTLKRTAFFVTQGPPWHDQVSHDSDPAKAWYTKHVGANFTPAPGKLTSAITTWDRPKPGWPRLNRQGKPLLEATAIWQFETYICVETADARNIYFNRAQADWIADYKWQSPDQVVGSVLTAPAQFTALTDRSRPAPIKGMLVNTGINPPNLEFRPP